MGADSASTSTLKSPWDVSNRTSGFSSAMGGFYRLSRPHAFRHALVAGEVPERRDGREAGAGEQAADGVALAGAVLEEEASAGREACRGAFDDRGQRFEAV